MRYCFKDFQECFCMERKGQVAFALAGLALAGYFFPPAGVIPAIAAFFLVPGAVMVSRLAGERLSKAEALAVSIVLSIIFSAHFSYWFSLAFGYSRETAGAIVVLLCIPAALVKMKVKKNDAAARVGSKKISREAKIAFGVAAALLLVLAGMYHNNFWVEREGRLVVGGWNWSDLFVHLPVALSINNGNFPPQMPFYAGEKLVYHYFSDFHSAVVSNYFGGSLAALVETMRWENSLLPPLFFALCFLLARRVAKKDSTALVAATLIVFGGGFSYYNLFEKQAQTGEDLLKLAGNSPFDNDGKLFQIPSVMGGYLLVQRPQMIGLPALAAVLLLLCVWKEEKRRSLILLAGIAAGLLAPFHYFAFATAMVAVTLFLLLELYEKKKIDFPAIAAAYLPSLLSLPFAFEALSTTGRAGNVKLLFGWLAPKQPLEFAAFYLANLGLPFILTLTTLTLVKGSQLQHKKELVALGAFCFLLPNAVALSGTVWDMAKFFTYLWIPVGILTASLLSSALEKLGNAGKLFAFAAIAFSVITPLQMIYWTASSNWSAMGEDELETGEWMAENTAQNSVFVTSTEHISPVDSVAGRLRVVGYAGWMNNFGLPYGEREALLPKAFCGSAQEKREAFEKLGARYLYSGSGERRHYPCDHSLGLRKIFSNRETAVYALE